jgi:peptide/nickel transport system substrate-binding protein
MDKYLQAAAVEMDEGKRRTYLQQAGELVAKERPLIPIVSVTTAWTLRKDRVRLERTRADEDTLAMDVVPAK